MKSNEKPGQHLPYDDERLQALRTHIKQLVASKEVHPRLIMNFDQVWSLRFRPKSRCLQKDSSLSGVAKDELSRSFYLRKVRHNLQLSLDLPLSEPNPAEKQPKFHVSAPTVTGGKAATATVQDWRVPRTVTTLSYVDGAVGRSFITLKDGTMSEDSRKTLSQELRRWVVIDQPQQKTHMWNEMTFLRYLNHLTQDVFSRVGYIYIYICANRF